MFPFAVAGPGVFVPIQHALRCVLGHIRSGLLILLSSPTRGLFVAPVSAAARLGRASSWLRQYRTSPPRCWPFLIRRSLSSDAARDRAASSSRPRCVRFQHASCRIRLPARSSARRAISHSRLYHVSTGMSRVGEVHAARRPGLQSMTDIRTR